MRFVKLDHAAVVCRSRQTADRFYENLLGLKAVKESVLDERLAEEIFHVRQSCTFLRYEGEGLAIEVFLVEGPGRKGVGFEHLCLEVEDQDAFLSRCKSAGVSVKRIQRRGRVLGFVDDGDGNLFEIKQRAKSL